MSDLPEGWTLSALEDLASNPSADIVDGPFGSNLKASEYQETGIPIIRLQNVKKNRFIDKNIKYVSGEKAKELQRHSFVAGDLVITKLGDPLGEAAIVPDKFDTGIIVADVVRARLNPRFADKRYVMYAINSPVVVSSLANEIKGTTRPRVNLGHIRRLEIPLAPLPEQKRIADKLDSLLARVDKCQAHLERVPALLKAFRQSVLAAATSGRLTDEWRKDEREIEVNGYSFPVSWNVTTFDDALTLIDGDRGPNYPKQSDYQLHGHCLFLSTKNVRLFGFEFDDLVFISEEKHKKLRAGTLQRGDVIITTRGTLGNVAYYDETVPFDVVRINSGMLILRSKLNNLMGKYLMMCIASPFFTTQLDEKRSGSAQPQIPAKTLKTFILPIPPLEEQHEIVRRVERLFAFAERLEARWRSAQGQVGSLTPSLLAKAFRGELV